jgi:nucleoside 2-deoxyribosyltransferase
VKKILLIGSTAYKDTIFAAIRADLEAEGFEVKVPAFDCNPMFNSYEICEYNRDCMEWCDEVRLIWDLRSTGTIFDLGMAFALRKPLRIEYLNPKTFLEVIEKWEKKSGTVQKSAESAVDGSMFTPTFLFMNQMEQGSGQSPVASGKTEPSSSAIPARSSMVTVDVASTIRARRRAKSSTVKTTN